MVKEKKQCILNSLNKKLEYYLNIKKKCDRFNLLITIDEHKEFINKIIKIVIKK